MYFFFGLISLFCVVFSRRANWASIEFGVYKCLAIYDWICLTELSSPLLLIVRYIYSVISLDNVSWQVHPKKDSFLLLQITCSGSKHPKSSWFNCENKSMSSLRTGMLGLSWLACLRARYAMNQVWCGQCCNEHFHSGVLSNLQHSLDLCRGSGPACSIWRTSGSVEFPFTLEPPEQKFRVQRYEHVYRRTGNDWISLISNHYNLNFYFTIGRYYQVKKQYR